LHYNIDSFEDHHAASIQLSRQEIDSCQQIVARLASYAFSAEETAVSSVTLLSTTSTLLKERPHNSVPTHRPCSASNMRALQVEIGPFPDRRPKVTNRKLVKAIDCAVTDSPKRKTTNRSSLLVTSGITRLRLPGSQSCTWFTSLPQWPMARPQLSDTGGRRGTGNNWR